MKKGIILIASCLFWIVGQTQKINFNDQWSFIQKDIVGSEVSSYNDQSWRKLNLPHDWSIEGEYDEKNPMGDKCGYLPAGIGWYRKTISVPKEWKGKQIEIIFDGVFMNSTVYANGVKLGVRPFGWITFGYDISEQVRTSNTITFAVRVDNDQQPSARWYTGSGIYANTWIDIRDNIHVVNDGVFVRTEGNTIKIDTEIKNTTTKRSKVILKTTFLDANGKSVQTIETKLKLESNGTQKVAQQTHIDNPSLWSIETPTLYKAVSEIYEGEKLVDRFETRFGIRDIKWIPETGMWINGKNVKIQGVCNHQDAGALGAAVPDKILRFRIQQLKDMGVNTIRTAHNPQTPQFYAMCDEIGMMVMDEIFDGWEQKATHDYGEQAFAKWWKKDLTDWLRRDRNHPSIVIYSVGNETHGDVGKDLVAECHVNDPTRPVTSGHSGSEFMDVFGVNGSSEKMGWFDTLPKDRVFIATENTHTWQVRGYYRTKTWYRDGYPSAKQQPYEIPDLTEKEVFTHDWIEEANRKFRKQIFNSSYDNATVRLTSRHNIAQIRDIPNYAGSFRWTGHDYLGEAGYVHGGWPFKAFMGGAIDMANFEKDLFYLYQSQWTTKPMVHILPHWTHPKMKLGTEIPVWVYSNCDTVELFFDGVSLGKINPGTEWDKMQCQWMVPYQPGALKAVGYKNGRIVSQETIRTADTPSENRLSIDGEPLSKSGNDIVQVRITVTDAKGEMYPYGENRTYFTVLGPGKIRALDNGSPVDVEKHFEASNRIAFYGLTRAYVETTKETGAVTLVASAILGEKKLITSNLVSIDTQVLALRGAAPKLAIVTYYTTDGTTPTVQSQKYSAPFTVTLGTTVKALVLIDGKPSEILSERFAEDEGFVWNDNPTNTKVIGDQAEQAKFTGVSIVTKGADFNGTGYLLFDKKQSGSVEWYQENDGGEAKAEIWIRYSAKVEGKTGSAIKLTVNGKVLNEKLELPNTKNLGSDWNIVKVKIKLGRGANNYKIEPADGSTFAIDEIVIK
ncbi:glycoside hydrolase family 2 TIM barrel-domain containing protein [Flavobacterium sp. 7A]|uniref:glycoside hydrolase family 2 TIM barrel-domain containing protein n=1 Tax=Flavobacterium sp. 7A TaxID=2940571 RepID=UPI002225C522|nr:glycoside hydrolase family 2 TIM barrel-domain containing protein [Flavobacterium sp. 7A]MCW2119037.1 beta-galactosidase [Flavobacterium sp. 7A]